MTFTDNIFLIGFFPWFTGLFYLTRYQEKSKRIQIFFANMVFYTGGVWHILIYMQLLSIDLDIQHHFKEN